MFTAQGHDSCVWCMYQICDACLEGGSPPRAACEIVFSLSRLWRRHHGGVTFAWSDMSLMWSVGAPPGMVPTLHLGRGPLVQWVGASQMDLAKGGNNGGLPPRLFPLPLPASMGDEATEAQAQWPGLWETTPRRQARRPRLCETRPEASALEALFSPYAGLSDSTLARTFVWDPCCTCS
jgi:hypothetical protein